MLCPRLYSAVRGPTDHSHVRCLSGNNLRKCCFFLKMIIYSPRGGRHRRWSPWGLEGLASLTALEPVCSQHLAWVALDL